MAVRARLALDFRGVFAEIGRPTVEIALGHPTHQHERAVAEDGVVDRLQRLHERNIPHPTARCMTTVCFWHIASSSLSLVERADPAALHKRPEAFPGRMEESIGDQLG